MLGVRMVRACACVPGPRRGVDGIQWAGGGRCGAPPHLGCHDGCLVPLPGLLRQLQLQLAGLVLLLGGAQCAARQWRRRRCRLPRPRRAATWIGPLAPLALVVPPARVASQRDGPSEPASAHAAGATRQPTHPATCPPTHPPCPLTTHSLTPPPHTHTPHPTHLSRAGMSRLPSRSMSPGWAAATLAMTSGAAWPLPKPRGTVSTTWLGKGCSRPVGSTRVVCWMVWARM